MSYRWINDPDPEGSGEVEREEEGKPNPGLRGWTKRKKFDGGIADRAANAEWVQRLRDKR